MRHEHTHLKSVSIPVSSKVTSLAISLSKSSIIVKVGIVNLIDGRSVAVVELRDGCMNIFLLSRHAYRVPNSKL